MNKIGDICILYWLIYNEWNNKSTDINIINEMGNKEWILLLIIIGGFYKSAQIYNHYWLPYSMEWSNTNICFNTCSNYGNS
jgi:NADH:ubiquinone oxidoreductase subunit 5 (subunit L)/multisubunit Na+/H+ antiporter MnhA subunit